MYISPPNHALSQLQQLVKDKNMHGISLVDDLIESRAIEVKNER